MIKNRTTREEIYHRNVAIKKSGIECKCPSCGKLFVKNSYQQCFCGKVCKDYYHNSKGDRHRAGYYREYNMAHPKRLEYIGVYTYGRNANIFRNEDIEVSEMF